MTSLHARKNLLGVPLILLPILGLKSSKPRFLGHEYASFSLTHKILKLAYCWNCCTKSNQILHSDEDYQIFFVGGLNTHVTNPRWQMAAILKKSKNCYISTAACLISKKFIMVAHLELANVLAVKNSSFKKFKIADVCRFEKNSHISVQFDRLTWNLVQWLYEPYQQLKFPFKKCKMVDGRCLNRLKNGHISATVWPISTQDGKVTFPHAAMRPFVKILWPIVIFNYRRYCFTLRLVFNL